MESFSGKGGAEHLPFLGGRPSTKNPWNLRHRFVLIILVGCLFLFLAVNIIPLLINDGTVVPSRWNHSHSPQETTTRTRVSPSSVDLQSPKELQPKCTTVTESGSEENRLLNITNFKWVRNNERACATSTTTTPGIKIIPVLVHTSRNHFLERDVIRRTWGSLQNYRNNFTIRPVFLIGEAGGKDMRREDVLLEEQKLDEEHELNGDIITGSFVDAYRNLTYKHMMGYKWILDYCPQAPLVLKADDDIFVDVTHFIDAHLNDSTTTTSKVVDWYCYEFAGTGPLRDEHSKWYITPQEYPARVYPNYCSGWAYGLSVEWMRKMYAMSLVSRYFWVDDVFTGILLQMARLAFREEPRIKVIQDWYTFDNKVYSELCSRNLARNSTEEEEEVKVIKAAKRKFGAAVWVDRGDHFARDMECLWRKTLIDKNLV